MGASSSRARWPSARSSPSGSTTLTPLATPRAEAEAPSAADVDFAAAARARFTALGLEGAWAAGAPTSSCPLSLPAAALSSALGPSVLAERLVDILVAASGGGSKVTFAAYLVVTASLRAGAPARARAEALLALFGARGGVLTRGALRGSVAAVLAERGIVATGAELDVMARASFTDVGETGLAITVDRLAAHLKRHPRAFADIALKF